MFGIQGKYESNTGIVFPAEDLIRQCANAGQSNLGR